MVFSHSVVCVCLAKAEGGEESVSVAELPLFTTNCKQVSLKTGIWRYCDDEISFFI